MGSKIRGITGRFAANDEEEGDAANNEKKAEGDADGKPDRFI